MELITEPAELNGLVEREKAAGNTIGLVPTMGNLHAGHLALVSKALENTDFVITSIFVNPLQFGPGEDLDAYPRTLEDDRKLLQEQGCHALFAPSAESIFGLNADQQSRVHVPNLSEGYCGASRPGHFDGVATIVCKLFNLARPDQAFFGLKDYQQFLVISKMVRDLAMNVSIQGVEIVREAGGLALSSRNNYLNQQQRTQAAAIYRSLQHTAQAIRAGERDYQALESTARSMLEEAGLRPDYFVVCRAQDLHPAREGDNDLAILAAAFLGPSRLIDNLRLTI